MNKKKNKKKRLIRLSLLRNKMTNIFEKKRFKFLGSFSILLHILAASWVLYAMLYNPKSINNSLKIAINIIITKIINYSYNSNIKM